MRAYYTMWEHMATMWCQSGSGTERADEKERDAKQNNEQE